MPDTAPIKILVVDDLPEKHIVYRAVLEEPGTEIVSAMSGEDALKAVLQSEFAVILLDINMPGMDGFETATMIRARKGCAHTPIIFITAFPDEVFALKGYALGAVDYILAPVVPNILRTKVGVFVQLYRLTQQVKTQAAHQVRRSEERFRAIIESALDAVVTIDAAGNITAWSAQAEAMFGWSADEVMGKLLASTIVPPAYRQAHQEGLRRFLKTGAGPVLNRLVEMKALHRDGHEISVELSITPIPVGDTFAFSGFIRDITERKRAENEIHALAAQRADLLDSERGARIEAERLGRLKDEFLATLSHELRTPLNAILGWAKLLRGPQTTPEDIAEGLEVIDRNAGVQVRLVEELLDMNRIISGKLSLSTADVDIAAAVAEALESIRLSAHAKQIELDFTPPARPLRTAADPSRVQQVIWNLLTNAIKFTPKGGRVTVELEADDESIVIRVRDTGEGIAPEFMPYLFDRFRQADAGSARRYGGLGLGLAIVKQLVDLHGGTVNAQSDGRGQGATLTVTLPRRTQAAVTPPATPPQVPPQRDSGYTLDGRRLTGIRILLVDDEPDSVNLARRFLEECDADVTVAYSAAEALRELPRVRPDVLISDIGMPGEDGYSLIRRIREAENGNARQLGAIAMTAFARPEDRARALEAGYQAHVTKPVDPGELVRIVAAVAQSLATEPQASACANPPANTERPSRERKRADNPRARKRAAPSEERS